MRDKVKFVDVGGGVSVAEIPQPYNYMYDLDSPSVPLRVKIAQVLGCIPKRDEVAYNCTCPDLEHGTFVHDGRVCGDLVRTPPLYPWEHDDSIWHLANAIETTRGLKIETEVDDLVSEDVKVLWVATSAERMGMGYTRADSIRSLVLEIGGDGPLLRPKYEPTEGDSIFVKHFAQTMRGGLSLWDDSPTYAEEVAKERRRKRAQRKKAKKR